MNYTSLTIAYLFFMFIFGGMVSYSSEKKKIQIPKPFDLLCILLWPMTLAIAIGVAIGSILDGVSKSQK